MARTKAFDPEAALDGAIAVFREHGFEGSSAGMLVAAMGVGRQSLYDTYGDKWRLYCAAVQRYALAEQSAHLTALAMGPRAIDGLRAMVGRVVEGARDACLGVGSVCEFGQSHPDLNEIRARAGAGLQSAIAARIREAQAEGDVAAEVAPEAAADFLVANFAGVRIAARGGAGPEQVRRLGELALRALG